MRKLVGMEREQGIRYSIKEWKGLNRGGGSSGEEGEGLNVFHERKITRKNMIFLFLSAAGNKKMQNLKFFFSRDFYYDMGSSFDRRENRAKE